MNLLGQQRQNLTSEILKILSESFILQKEVRILNKQKYIKDLKSTNLDNSKKFDGKVLWLPSSTNLSEKDISFISNKINKFTSRT